MAADPQALIAAELDRLAGTMPALGVAVSGGGDSMALLHIAAAWGRRSGVRVEAASVDHRLRPESTAECRMVAQVCAGLDVAHTVLTWTHGDRIEGNRMAAARNARMRLLAQWAGARGLGAIALGHTQDDQAETLLMRLGRGAGVDGLSGMAPARQQAGAVWLRPMLGVRRADLRRWLADRGVGWVDDPGNDDRAYQRVRVRQAIAASGLSVAAIARSAALLAEARTALAQAAAAAAAGVQADRGVLRLPIAALAQPPDIRRRLIAAALRWITGDDYAPRGEEITRLAAVLDGGGQATLAGTIARPRRAWVEFIREPAAVRPGLPLAPSPAGGAEGVVWDNRWIIEGLPPGARIERTSPADLAARDWRAAGLPRPALLSSPAIHAQGRIALPLLDGPASGALRPLRGRDEYLSVLQAH